MFSKTYLSSDGPTSPQERVKLNKSPTAEELLPFLVLTTFSQHSVRGGGSPLGLESIHSVSSTTLYRFLRSIKPLHVTFQLFSNKTFHACNGGGKGHASLAHDHCSQACMLFQQAHASPVRKSNKRKKKVIITVCCFGQFLWR